MPELRGIMHQPEQAALSPYQQHLLGPVLCLGLIFSSLAYGEEQAVLRLSSARSVTDTGLIHYLAEDFKSQHPGVDVLIRPVGALQALDDARRGQADVVISHHPPKEQRFVEQGFGLYRTQFMASQYAIFGPPDDPYKLAEQEDIVSVLKILVNNEVVFLAPSPRSGTYHKLEDLWSLAGINPDWLGYENTYASGMATLLQAAEFGGYSLADMGTYLMQRDKVWGNIAPLYRGDAALHNIYSVILVNPGKVAGVNFENAKAFHNYLVSNRGQDAIRRFALEKFNSTYLEPIAHGDPGLRARRAAEALESQSRNLRIMTMLVAGLMLTIVFIILLALWLRRAERKRLLSEKQSELLIQARDAAHQADMAKSQFLANMSHEIRTPLTAIIGYAETLLESDQKMQERSDAVKTIIRSGEHLLHLINEILDLSKIEAHKLELEQRPIEVIPLVNEVKALIQKQAADKGLRFEIKYVFPLPRYIQTDPLRLKQVLFNLCSNAVKFTERGTVSIKLGCDATQQMMSYQVIDTGIGMNEEQAARIFETFTQADASTTRKYGGTGLGLALSQRLAELMGGKITLSSTAGEGSCFTLMINTGPLEYIEWLNEVRKGDEIAEPQARQWSAQRLSGRVLLAEDNPDNQRLISLLLNKMGVQVSVVDNGAQAAAQALQTPFDLVLMDMQMPVMGGLEAVRALRARGYSGPIVALTANAMREDRDRCLAAGFNDFMTKPVRRDTLYAVTTRYLTRAMEDNQLVEPLVSNLLEEEPEFADIVQKFITNLPAKQEAIRRTLEAQDWPALKTILHELKGSGGGMGFPQLTEIAAKIESQIISEYYPHISSMVDELHVIIDRIYAGQDSSKLSVINQ